MSEAKRITDLETRVAALQRLLSDVCSDWSDDDDDLHARCDAILGPEIVPPKCRRTPVAGDDGRVAAAFRKLEAENANLHEQVKRLRRFVTGTGCCCLTVADGTDTSDQCRRCSLLVATAPKEPAK